MRISANNPQPSAFQLHQKFAKQIETSPRRMQTSKLPFVGRVSHTRKISCYDFKRLWTDYVL